MTNQIEEGRKQPQKWFSPFGALPAICSGLALAILVILIPPVLAQPGNPENNPAFVMLVIVSVILAIAGLILLIMSAARPRNIFQTLDVFFLLLYFPLLLFFLRSIYF